MGRSGYTDDFGDDGYPLALYRRAVQNAIKGRRGQALLLKLRDALDALPSKRLIAKQIKDGSGDVCAFGALDPTAPSGDPEDDWDEFGSADRLARHFGIARSLASEIVYMNDEALDWRSNDETPEQRWSRMRAWVAEQIGEAQGSAG
jgi:hypothetical protein